MNILDLLASDNYLIFNKTLANEYGLDVAIILGELVSEYNYWESKNLLEDDYFYSTVENMQKNTTLSKYQQTQALNKLLELGIIDYKVKGIPPKRYIKINENSISKIFNFKKSKNLTFKSQKIRQLKVKKLDTNNNNIKIINKNNKYNNYCQRDLSDLENLYSNRRYTNDRE